MGKKLWLETGIGPNCSGQGELAVHADVVIAKQERYSYRGINNW